MVFPFYRETCSVLLAAVDTKYLDLRGVHLLHLLSSPSGPAEGAHSETREGDWEGAEQKPPAPEGTIWSHHRETPDIHRSGRSAHTIWSHRHQTFLHFFWYDFWSKICLFFSQLINDKKSLSERCEGVVGELKQVDQKYTKKIAQMQEQHEMVRIGLNSDNVIMKWKACAGRAFAAHAFCFSALHLVWSCCFLAVLLLFNRLFSVFPSFFAVFLCPCLYIYFFWTLGVANSGSLVWGNLFSSHSHPWHDHLSHSVIPFPFHLSVPHNFCRTACLRVSHYFFSNV